MRHILQIARSETLGGDFSYMLASRTLRKVGRDILGDKYVTTTEICPKVLTETLRREMRLEFQ